MAERGAGELERGRIRVGGRAHILPVEHVLAELRLPARRRRRQLRIREPGWYQHRVLKGPDTDVNLHVFSAGCPEIERMLAFRDRLRNDDAERALYERTKRELVARRWRYVQNYADAKTEVVEAIIARALQQRASQ